jgi:hypothetical protein
MHRSTVCTERSSFPLVYCYLQKKIFPKTIVSGVKVLFFDLDLSTPVQDPYFTMCRNARSFKTRYRNVEVHRIEPHIISRHIVVTLRPLIHAQCFLCQTLYTVDILLSYPLLSMID